MEGIRANFSTVIPASQVAAERYAYITLEHMESETNILQAIEHDLRSGMSPKDIGSVWRRVSSFENMPKLVEMAARHMQRSRQSLKGE